MHGLADTQNLPPLSIPDHGNDRHSSSNSSTVTRHSSPPPYEVAVNRHRSKSTYELTSPRAANPSDSVFTPSSPPVVVSSLKRSSSSSQLYSRPWDLPTGSENINSDEDVLYAVSPKSTNLRLGLRPRRAADSMTKAKERSMTSRLDRGGGETETDLEEPPRTLPTSRRLPTLPPLSPPTPLARVTPILYQAFRLLACVPAFAGASFHIRKIYHPPDSYSRLDYFVCFLWALLTAHQCLRLTTGLLTRWKAYYSPLSTLIRLLALQAICWPATHFTLLLLDHERRPVICWAVIGSTTCVSRSIQIWVTSNLWGPSNVRLEGKATDSTGTSWRARRWDWSEVGLKCAMPMGIAYFAMAWAEALRRELSGC